MDNLENNLGTGVAGSSSIDGLAEGKDLELDGAYGLYLQNLRKKNDLSIEQLSSQTRIRADYIFALESEDLDSLPGKVFARGFIGAICKNLGCSETERKFGQAKFDLADGLSREAHSGLRSTGKESKLTKSAGFAKILLNDQATLRSVSGPVYKKLFYFLGLVLAALIAAYFVWPTGSVKKETLSVQETASPTPEPLEPEALLDEEAFVEPALMQDTEEVVAEAGVEEARVDETAVEVGDAPVNEARPAVAAQALGQAFTDASKVEFDLTKPVRIRFRKDKELWKTKDFPKGYLEIDFESRLELLIFDAAAVNLTFNGKPLGPLGDSGKVRRLTFDRAE